jgi:FixJ family two-component response regulator
MKPVVFIVDDDPSVRKALGRILSASGLDTVTFGSGDEFLECFDAEAPGCLVLDLEMPGLGGLELQHTLVERGVSLPVLFLTGRGSIQTSVCAMKDGAIDFLTKPVDADALLAAVKVALDRDVATRDAQNERHRIERRLATLTPREREVLPYVLSGRLSKQIASDLSIVEKTVKVHRSRIMHKLETKSVAELVRLAGRAGILPTER